MEGRPIKWTQERKETAMTFVLQQIADGKSVKSIFDKREIELPTRSMFHTWLIENSGFLDKYEKSMIMRSDIIFDEILEIADETANDEIDLGDGIKAVNHEAIQRARLKIDARKWILAKMVPKKYGDKVDVTSGGEKVNIPIIEWVKNHDQD